MSSLHRIAVSDILDDFLDCPDAYSAMAYEISQLRQQMTAALAERDALREQVTCGEHERMALVVVADAIRDDRTEARRVLREISELLPCDTPCDNHDAAPACPTCGHEEHVYKCAGCMARGALAAVLAQEEK